MANAEKSTAAQKGESPKGASRPRRSPAKRVAFAALAVSLILVLLEGLLSVIWVAIDVNSVLQERPKVEVLREEYHCEYDEELGWANKPSTKLEDFYGKGRSITINSNGVRGLTDFDEQKPEKTFRTICLGDSFTLGYGVDDPDTFPHQLQSLAGDGQEVVNMGQGGYSVGQCHLWLKRLGPKLKPDLVVCVFIIEDFRRLLIERTANGFATPQFTVTDEEGLTVSNIPVPAKLEAGSRMSRQGEIVGAMKKSSALFRTIGQVIGDPPAPTDEEALFVGAHIIKATAALCRELDCPIVFALIPTLPELRDSGTISRYEAVSRVIAELMKQEQISFFDLQPAFLRERNIALRLFLTDAFQHYSVEGNAIVARELDQWLRTTVPDYGSQPE